MSAIEKLYEAVETALDECPVSEVLSALTGSFVGLTVELTRQQGADVDNHPITIEGGSRKITIYPPEKAVAK